MKRAEIKSFIDTRDFPIIDRSIQKRLAEILEDTKITQGETLKRMRETVGLTQKELAEVLKISQTLVSLWEKGQKQPDPYMLQWIAVLYGFSIEKFLFQFGYELPENDSFFYE